MKTESIYKAYKLAWEFINRVDALKADKPEINQDLSNYSPKHRGAVRRISMELTRALSEMRRA
jgi:hypothetical protein